MDFVIEDDNWPEEIMPIAQKAIEIAIEEVDVELSGPSEIAILLTNDKRQQELNNNWRKKNKSTNVLSFPQVTKFSKLNGLIGDISFAFETIKKEAEQLNINFSDHFIHLLIHGFLHLLSYNHENEKQAKIMEMTEIKILEKMGIANPYNLDILNEK